MRFFINRSLWRMCGGQKGISQEQQPGEKMWVFNVLFNQASVIGINSKVPTLYQELVWSRLFFHSHEYYLTSKSAPFVICIYISIYQANPTSLLYFLYNKQEENTFRSYLSTKNYTINFFACLLDRGNYKQLLKCSSIITINHVFS